MKEQKTLQPKFTGERKTETDSHDQVLALLAMIEMQNPEAKKPAETLPEGWVLKKKQRLVHHTFSEEEKNTPPQQRDKKNRFNLLGSLALVLVYERNKTKNDDSKDNGANKEKQDLSGTEHAERTKAAEPAPDHTALAEQAAEEEMVFDDIADALDNHDTTELLSALEQIMPEEALMPYLQQQVIPEHNALPIPTMEDYTNSYVTAVAHNPHHDALIQEAQHFIAQQNQMILPQATSSHLQLAQELIQEPHYLETLALNTSPDMIASYQLPAPHMAALPEATAEPDGAVPFIGGNVFLNFGMNKELAELPAQPMQEEQHVAAIEQPAPSFDYSKNPFYLGATPNGPMPNFSDPAFGGSGSSSTNGEGA